MTNQLTTTVQDVKTAVGAVQSTIWGDGFEIAKIDLELKTSVKYLVGVDGKVEVIGLELSGAVTETSVQTIQLSLVPPKPPAVAAKVTITEQLAKAISVISEAVKQAAASAPVFLLSEASVTLNFVVDAQGKISVIVVGGMDVEKTHTVKLTLKPHTSN